MLLLELMDCVEDLVLLLDPGLRVIRANRSATAFWGYSASELALKPLSSLLGAGDRGPVAEFAAAAKERRGGEAVFLPRSGRKALLRFSLSPLAGTEGKAQGFLLVGRRAEKEDLALRGDASNGLAERMLRGFADPLFIVDGPSRTVCDCNEAALAAFGFHREEILGRRLFECAEGSGEGLRNEAIFARADANYATAGIFQERVFFPQKQGGVLPCDLTGLPFFNHDGSLSFIIVLLFDRSSEEERKAELGGLIERVNGLAAELTALAASSSTPAEPERLSSLGFTKRQVEIARLVALGASTKEIAFRLRIAESTVKNHLSGIFRKLGVTTRMGFMRELSTRRIRIA